MRMTADVKKRMEPFGNQERAWQARRGNLVGTRRGWTPIWSPTLLGELANWPSPIELSPAVIRNRSWLEWPTPILWRSIPTVCLSGLTPGKSVNLEN